jgi:hypothetical protein
MMKSREKTVYNQVPDTESPHHAAVKAIRSLHHRSMQGFQSLNPGPGSLQPAQTRDKKSFKPPCHAIPQPTHTCEHSRNPSSTNHARSIHPEPSVPPHPSYPLVSFKPNATRDPLCQHPPSGRPPPEMDGRQLISRRLESAIPRSDLAQNTLKKRVSII